MDQERLDRQLRIEDWNQEALDNTKIGVVGDFNNLLSFYILSASALGINKFVAVSPYYDNLLLNTAKKVNNNAEIIDLEGLYTNKNTNILDDCDMIADLSNYRYANKLLLEKAYLGEKPLLMSSSDNEGFNLFSYKKGREWSDLEEVISKDFMPKPKEFNPVLDMIGAGILLEETKDILMKDKYSKEIINYKRKSPILKDKNQNILMVGAGALGNFASLGLAYSGFKNITLMDPDKADFTNLNRQVLLYNSIGDNKAETLAKRLNKNFGTNVIAKSEYFDKDTNIDKYDIIFDCVDNFQTRIILSEKCEKNNLSLISGGTNVNAGQMIVYNSENTKKTPAEVLDLYDIVKERENIEISNQNQASCVYRPDPSVIMTNQIIGGLMVDAYMQILSGRNPKNIFYDSNSDKKM